MLNWSTECTSFACGHHDLARPHACGNGCRPEMVTSYTKLVQVTPRSTSPTCTLLFSSALFSLAICSSPVIFGLEMLHLQVSQC